MSTWFVADTHLKPDEPRVSQAFLSFLSQSLGNCQALYILGDLFEYWIGDDYESPLSQQVTTALKQLTIQGTTIYFAHGNRDFLIQQDFAKRSGCQLLEEITRIDLYGIPTLILHGDLLCTDDTDYFTLRAQLRSHSWQSSFLAKPIEERLKIAEQYRQQSQSAQKSKEAEIMDVNQDSVQALLDRHNIKRMIHGHTHRPAAHQWEHTGQFYERIVLGSWHHQAWALEVTVSGYELHQWPL